MGTPGVRRDERLDLTFADRLAPRPRSRACRSRDSSAAGRSPTSWMSAVTASGSARTLTTLELPRDPLVQLLDVERRGPRPPSRTPSREPSSTSAPRPRARARSRAPERRGSRRSRRRPPPSSRPCDALHRPCCRRRPDHDQARVAEQAARVAQTDRRLARRVERAHRLDRLRLEVSAEPRERRFDLRAVASGDQVDRLVGSIGHGAQTTAAFER